MNSEPRPSLWADRGPISQGKILTDLLQGHTEDAKFKLVGWTRADLVILARAAERLAYLSRQEAARKELP